MKRLLINPVDGNFVYNDSENYHRKNNDACFDNEADQTQKKLMSNSAICTEFNKKTPVFSSGLVSDLVDFLLHNSVDEIFIITGPVCYTAVRKCMAIAKAYKMVFPSVLLYGFNILRDYMRIFGSYAVYRYKNFTYCLQNDSIQLIKSEIHGEPISNEEWLGKTYKKISCDSLNIFQNLELLKKPFMQSYTDSFIW